MAETCRTCRWFSEVPVTGRGAKVGETGVGSCKARAPLAAIDSWAWSDRDPQPQNEFATPLWPVVSPDDGCGDHKPREGD